MENSPPDAWLAYEKYIEDVIAGRRPASKLEQLAVQRHLRDLETADARGLTFSPTAAMRPMRFFPMLLHPRGPHAYTPFVLSGFQAFQIANVYGWLRHDGTRRFRDVFEEVPRKNGKTTKLAGIGLYGLIGDREPGPNVFAAATKRDQAKILFDEAKLMRQSSPAVRRKTKKTRDTIHVPDRGAVFTPLGADADTLEGLNPSMALIDEFQSHKSRDLHDVLDTATGARLQPLIWRIGTAGFDRSTICWEQREHSIQVLEGSLDDDDWFCFLATIDQGDDPGDPTTWTKANPNLGITPSVESMERAWKRAQSSTGAMSSFLRYRLDVWTQAEEGWLDLDVWDRNATSWQLEEMKDVPCYGGLDLSSTTDLTALALCWPPSGQNDRFRFAVWHWIPEERAMEAQRRDRVPYLGWARDGHLILTEGNVVDYSEVRRKIHELSALFQVQEVAYDRYNATETALALQADGIRMIEQAQSIGQFSEPSKKFYRLLAAHSIDHGGNPLLRWQAGNVAIRTDENDNIKPTKRHSKGRIDGIIAMLMALARTIHSEGPSVYNTRGLLTL